VDAEQIGIKAQFGILVHAVHPVFAVEVHPLDKKVPL
jgi:hypothetical protein